MIINREERIKYMYDNYYQYSFALTRQIIKHYHDSEDNVSDIGITVIKNIDNIQLENQKKVKGWVTKVTENRAKDYFRKTNRKNKDISIDSEDEKTLLYRLYDFRSVETLYIERMKLLGIWNIIDGLKDKYKEVYLPYVIHKLPIKYIADKTGIKEETVKKRISRARKLIRMQAKLEGWY